MHDYGKAGYKSDYREATKKQRRNQSASGLEFAFNQELQYLCSNKSFL